MFCESPSDGPLRQAEILTDVVEPKLRAQKFDHESPTVDYRIHPYALIISQDCDLDLDFKERQSDDNTADKDKLKPRLIPNILLCEAVTASDLKGQSGMNTKLWQRIRTNQDIRYQFISSIDAIHDAQSAGLPELALDFKRFFCIPTELLYHQVTNGTCNRRTLLEPPYVQHLSQRFSNYLARVALPHDYISEPDH